MEFPSSKIVKLQHGKGNGNDVNKIGMFETFVDVTDGGQTNGVVTEILTLTYFKVQSKVKGILQFLQIIRDLFRFEF